jgi:hypothetical protein
MFGENKTARHPGRTIMKKWFTKLALVLVAVMLLEMVSIPKGVPAASSSGSYNEDFSGDLTKDFSQNTVWDKWNHEVRLRRSSAIEQSLARVSAAPDGGLYIAWLERESLYLQRLDSHGRPLWPNAQKVNSGPLGTTISYGMWSVLALPQGGALVTWPGVGVRGQRFDENGAALWNNELVFSAAYDNLTKVATALYPDGSFLVVWPNSGLKAQRYKADGTALWTNPVVVSAGTAPNSPAFPEVGVDSNGRAVIGWYDTTTNYASGSWGDLYVQSLDSDGGRRWAADVLVNQTAGHVNNDRWGTFSLAVGADGESVLTWIFANNNSQRSIHAQRLSNTGARLWAEDVVVAQPDCGDCDEFSLEGNSPAVTLAADGSATFVFLRDTFGPRFQIYAQRLSSTGQHLWTYDVALTFNRPVVYYMSGPAIGITPDQHVWAVWREGVGESHLYAQTLDADGNWLIPSAVAVADDPGSAGQTEPALGVGPDGSVYAAWDDNRRGQVDVYLSRLKPDGSLAWKNDIRVNGDDPHARANNYPKLAVDQNGNALIVYTRQRENTFQMYAQLVDVNGNKIWPQEVALTEEHTMYGRVDSVTVDPFGNFGVAWSQPFAAGEYTWINDVMAQKVDPSGNKLWSEWGVKINQGDPELADGGPVILGAPDGDFFVLWTRSTTGNAFTMVSGVMAQKLSPLGVRLWADDIQINAADEAQLNWTHVTGAVLSDGSLAAGWPGEGQTYLGRLAVDGSRIWAKNIKTDYFYPVSASPAKQQSFYLLDNSGGLHRVDQNGVVNTPARGPLSGSGVLASAPGGPVVGVGASSLDGDANLTVSLVEPAAGGSTWPDVLLAQPELFYMEQGVVQSLAVDTLLEPITRATLTADYNLEGGQVVFWLSNNGGADWQMALPGVATFFTSSGSDLRWKAEFFRDPSWSRRSPVIHRVQIDYSSETAGADSYEVDDSCQEARAIEAKGAPQVHTFQSAQDVDWVTFKAKAGVTYFIQASQVQANADITLALYDSCGASAPLLQVNDPYSRAAQIAWQAPANGWFELKVSNQAAGGLLTGYELSLREEENNPVVLIVVGPGGTQAVDQALQKSADRVYKVFLDAVAQRADLRYLAPDINRDVDNNGLMDDVYSVPSHGVVRESIQNWARERGAGLGRPFYLFILGPGEPGQVLIGLDGGSINPAELDLWLANLETTSGVDQVNIILDAAYSGSFISAAPGLSRPKRVVITSSSDQEPAFHNTDGSYFTDALIPGLKKRLNLHQVFQMAKKMVQDKGLKQTPCLDDNGDGQAEADSLKVGAWLAQAALPDGLLAAGRGPRLPETASLPVVDSLQIGHIQGHSAWLVTAMVRAEAGVQRVYLVVTSAWAGADGGFVSRTYELPAGSSAGLYQLELNGLSFYDHLTVIGVDAAGNESEPAALQVLPSRTLVIPLVKGK